MLRTPKCSETFNKTNSKIFNNIQPCSGILKNIKTYLGIFETMEPQPDIFGTLREPCIYIRAILRALVYLQPEASSKASRISKMIRHIQSTGILRTAYSSIFKDIQACSGILMHIQPHSQACNQGREERPPLLFLKIEKMCLHFGKKGPDCVHPWVKFFI